MGFNSLVFLAFAPLAVAGNALLRGRWWRLWMIAASYVFYGWATPWYCLLLLASTLLDFSVGRGLAHTDRPAGRRTLLLASLIGNLGLLGVFKYAALIADTLNQFAAWAGLSIALPVPQVHLPVGISFYTFQTLSYTIDVYRRRVEPTRSFTTFALYVAFFPQLVAGPIERADHLLPQLADRRPRSSEDVLLGTSRIFWGLLKKVVFADGLAVWVNQVYTDPGSFSGPETLLAVYAFAFQLYLDFSAYSDIAIGLARVMGIELRENFRWPYMARNPGEYWQRWHISLSTWMRDYVFFPLGGSRHGTARTLFNVTLVFALAGLWHGASWKFVVWGLYIATAVGLMNVWGLLRGVKIDTRPERPFRPADTLAIVGTFHVFCLSKLVFRADSVQHAGQIVARLAEWGGDWWTSEGVASAAVFTGLAAAAHVSRGLKPARWFSSLPAVAHGVLWGIIAIAILFFRPEVDEQFIYFQF